jgi:hypothetical protein
LKCRPYPTVIGCVRAPDKTVDYVLALLADITERKQMRRNCAGRESLSLESRRGLPSCQSPRKTWR